MACQELLSTQSFVYWKRLANYRLIRNEWIARSTSLLRRQAQLTHLEVRSPVRLPSSTSAHQSKGATGGATLYGKQLRQHSIFNPIPAGGIEGYRPGTPVLARV